MKNGRDFRAPLSATAKAIIESVPKLNREYVFSTNGRAPISGWGHMKAKIDKLMSAELGKEIANWRLHDLRRTAGARAWATEPK